MDTDKAEMTVEGRDRWATVYGDGTGRLCRVKEAGTHLIG
jgi:hypothetical protein